MSNNSTLNGSFSELISSEFLTKKLVIYTYSLSDNLIKEVLIKFGSKIVLTKELKSANIILGLKKHLQQNYKLQSIAQQNNIPIYNVKQNSLYQIIKFIQFILF